MVKPFSSASVFCLSWRIHGKTHSIWCQNLEKLLVIYFSVNTHYKGLEITYFPAEGKYIRLFKRDKQ